MGQVAVAVKSNEIPAVRDLLACFDLAGVVVTVDAMHTQVETAQAIIDAGGAYLFTVRKNQPTLHRACKDLPWNHVPGHRVTTRGHGRRVTRTIKVVTAPAWVHFADHHAAPPATLAAWVQGHWGIENRLHWVRHTKDVTYDEDR